MLKMVRGWLERGVDGFRCECSTHSVKAGRLLSNPRRYRGRPAYDRQSTVRKTAGLVDFLADSGRSSTRSRQHDGGRAVLLRPLGAVRLSAPRHLVFDWWLINTPWKAEGFVKSSEAHAEMFRETGWPTVVLSNHDRSRQRPRLAPKADTRTSDEIARAAAVLSRKMMRGTPFLYTGRRSGLATCRCRGRTSTRRPATVVRLSSA